MKVLKVIINIVLSFLLIFVIIGMILLNLVSNTILNKEYIISQLEEKEFYTQISREVKSGFEDYIYQSGLPEEVFEEIYTDEMIKSDLNSIINYVYEGTEITTSEETVRKNIDSNINQYLEEQGITLNSLARNSIETFKDLIVERYKENISVSNSTVTMVKEKLEYVNVIYNKIKNIPIIAMIIMIILIIIINIKTIICSLNMISISLLSSGILFKLFEMVIVKNIDIDNLLILSASLSNLITGIVRDMLYTISNYGTISIVVGITGIIISSMIKANLKETE